jgi:hypothetical protein
MIRVDCAEGARRDRAEKRRPTPLLRRLGSALATFYTRAERVDRRCYAIAVVLFSSGLFHLAVQAVVGGPWEGPVSWRKPTTFGLAFGLTLATLTWVTTFVPLRGRTRGRLLAVFATACAVEVGVITLQAWRGVPSHFNVSTPLNAALAYTAAGGGAIIIATALAFTAAATRPDPAVPISMRLAVLAGFVSFLAALAIGAFMIALGVNATRTISQAAAYTVATAFKSGHAATMHGILILPALAWLGSFADWSEIRRVCVILLACVGYFLAAGVVVVDTFVAVSPLAPLEAPLITSLLAGAGLLSLLTASGMTLVALRRAPAVPGLEHP